MKIILKHQAIEKKNNDVCIVTEHPLDDEVINFATAKMTGRYPSAGYVRNHKCKEIAYVNEGNGKIIVNDKEHLLNAGDLVMIEAGEKFCWEGNMHISLSCTPAWTQDQFEFVD